MKNRLISLLLTAIMIVTLIPGTAFAKTYGGEFTGTTSDPNGNPYILTWIFDEASATLYIEGVGGMVEYNSTGSNTPWAAHKNKIEHLVMEEGITTVGKRGFAGLSALKTIQFPSTLTTLAMRAFENCTSLETLTIPGTLKNIGGQAFLACKALKNVYVEEGVSMISEFTFGNCTALTDIYFYGKDTKISRARSNQDDGVIFRGCNFDILTAHCYEDTDVYKYCSEDIYTITNWSVDQFGNKKPQEYNEKQNSMTAGGYTLKVEPLTE